MTKASASQLKAKMGKFMRAVRAGQTVLITDRGTPVARLEPVGGAREHVGPILSQPCDPSAPPLGQVETTGFRYRGTDSGAILREDRRR